MSNISNTNQGKTLFTVRVTIYFLEVVVPQHQVFFFSSVLKGLVQSFTSSEKYPWSLSTLTWNKTTARDERESGNYCSMTELPVLLIDRRINVAKNKKTANQMSNPANDFQTLCCLQRGRHGLLCLHGPPAPLLTPHE